MCIYPGKKNSWLEKGSTEWFIVVYSIQQQNVTIKYSNPIFISIFLQMMETEFNYSNGGNLTTTFTHWQFDYSNQTTVFK